MMFYEGIFFVNTPQNEATHQGCFFVLEVTTVSQTGTPNRLRFAYEYLPLAALILPLTRFILQITPRCAILNPERR